MSFDYICAGISIINDIVYADGKKKLNKLGGCGVFSYDGIALFTDSVLLLSSGGPDFWTYYEPYFTHNMISKEGIYLTLPYTHHTLLEYEADGSWHEESLYGPDYFRQQARNNRTSYLKLRPFLNTHTKGLYLDAHADEDIFNELDLIRDQAPQMKIMWEPPTGSAFDPCLHEQVMADIFKVDYYSLNLKEAAAFFNKTQRQDIIRAIMDLDRPCFLREGENGASWIEDKKITSLPAFAPEKAVDVTGCGNCSTAAALYGKAEGLDPEKIVFNANLAAAWCARTDGPTDIKKARENVLAIIE